jgi:homoserine O-acetyltransferase
MRQVQCVIGGSLGGMQTMEWLFTHSSDGGSDDPNNAHFARAALPLACGSHHHTWQIAVSETQRQCIYSDLDYLDGKYSADAPPRRGLALARQIAMVSYRSHTAYEDKFGRRRVHDGGEVESDEADIDAPFSVESYLQYQGQKFLSRFDANSYITMTQLMDSHDIGRGRGGVEAAARTITQPVHVVGIDSDALYPISEQQALANMLPNGNLSVVRSDDGHDGFLLAQDAIGPIMTEFLEALE